MKSRHFLPAMALLGLTGSASAIKIEIRYDYDTNGFFNQPGSKEALRLVADYYEQLIHDSLLEINHTQHPSASWTATFEHPATGASEFPVSNLVVPADTLIVFAGGRSLGTPDGRGGPGGYGWSGFQNWGNLVAARGQAGALTTPKTDFGPWGGSIAFDTTRTWNFTASPVSGSKPFFSIALHEFGHLLGIGLADSWRAKMVNGNFTGAYSVAAYGGNVPLTATGGHWRDDEKCVFPDGHDPTEPKNVLSKVFGSFNSPHGFDQIALMDPSSCSAGPFLKVMTDLDHASLRDIGWEVEPPAQWINADVNPATSPFEFSWASSSGYTYRIQKSTSMANGDWSTIATFNGNGLIQEFSTPAPGDTAAFYRLNTDPPAPAAFAVEPPTAPPPATQEARMADDCHCGSSWGCD
jgi:hypothetical protein